MSNSTMSGIPKSEETLNERTVGGVVAAIAAIGSVFATCSVLRAAVYLIPRFQRRRLEKKVAEETVAERRVVGLKEVV